MIRHFVYRPATLRFSTATLLSWLLAGSFAFAQTAPEPTRSPPPVAVQPRAIDPAQGAPPLVPSATDPATQGSSAAAPPLPLTPVANGGILTGTIVVSRPYLVQIQSPSQRYITLELHRGTIINPLGTTLVPGMRVSARGTPRADGSITTDQIDLQARTQSRPPARPDGPGRRGIPRSLQNASPPPPRAVPPR